MSAHAASAVIVNVYDPAMSTGAVSGLRVNQRYGWPRSGHGGPAQVHRSVRVSYPSIDARNLVSEVNVPVSVTEPFAAITDWPSETPSRTSTRAPASER